MQALEVQKMHLWYRYLSIVSSYDMHHKQTYEWIYGNSNHCISKANSWDPERLEFTCIFSLYNNYMFN